MQVDQAKVFTLFNDNLCTLLIYFKVQLFMTNVY